MIPSSSTRSKTRSRCSLFRSRRIDVECVDQLYPQLLRARSSIWSEQRTHNPLVAGSSPAGPTIDDQALLQRLPNKHTPQPVPQLSTRIPSNTYGSRLLVTPVWPQIAKNCPMQMPKQASQYPQNLPVRISEGMSLDLKRVAEYENTGVSELTRRFVAEGIGRWEQATNPFSGVLMKPHAEGSA